ncbi:hypothetical protein LXL04_032992 [Taraxacum kok-saghyz]
MIRQSFLLLVPVLLLLMLVLTRTLEHHILPTCAMFFITALTAVQKLWASSEDPSTVVFKCYRIFDTLAHICSAVVLATDFALFLIQKDDYNRKFLQIVRISNLGASLALGSVTFSLLAYNTGDAFDKIVTIASSSTLGFVYLCIALLVWLKSDYVEGCNCGCYNCFCGVYRACGGMLKASVGKMKDTFWLFIVFL